MAALFGCRRRAHEIGTTRVAVTFPQDGSYRIEIVTDASSLLDKLETAAGQPRSGASEARDICRRGSGARRPACRAGSRCRSTACACSRRSAIERRAVDGRRRRARRNAGADRARSARRERRSRGSTAGRSRRTRCSVQTPRRPASRSTQWLEGGDTSAPVSLDGVAAAGVAAAAGRPLRRARVHAHPAEGARSRAVRARRVPPEPQDAADPDAGERVHHRALDHARARACTAWCRSRRRSSSR